MKKYLSTLVLGCSLIASTTLTLVNCTDHDLAKFTVTFNMDGGTPTVEDKIVKAGDLLCQPKPDPSKEGYTFEGWFKDEGLTQAFDFTSEKISANSTLYAKWMPKEATITYTVTFNANGGLPNVDDKTVEAGTLLAKPSPDPSKEGYTFEGWFKDEGLTQAFNFTSEKISANSTLYAKWMPEEATITYTVTFNANGGLPNVDDKTVEAGTLLAKPSPDPSKEGYTFEGWFKDEGLTQAFNFTSEKISANSTLYAKWMPEEATITYTVTFNANGGLPNVDDKTVEAGTLLAKPSPDPSKEGYTFAGWHKDEGLTQAFNFTSEKISANSTLYAKWEHNLVGIPDANFRAKLKALMPTAFVGDSLDSKNATVTSLTTLNIASSSIRDLTGIRYFTALTELNCLNNQLTALDVSANTALTSLLCNINQLGSLDISTNVALTVLGCGSNQLNNLDVSTNTALTTLICRINQLTDLDVSNNTALTTLWCNNNKLTDLDVSVNTALTRLDCGKNSLTGLDVSANTALTELNCSENSLTGLDVSTNTALAKLYCSSDNLTGLDVSTNIALTELDCNDNSLAKLDVSNNTALAKLYCNENQLDSLDVSANTVLTELYCNSNQLDSLDVSANTALTQLSCNKNQLTHLDMRGMRSVVSISIQASGDDRTNVIEVLQAHESLRNHAEIKKVKAARGGEVIIETYSAATGSASYTIVCNDYDPTANNGKGVCNDTP